MEHVKRSEFFANLENSSIPCNAEEQEFIVLDLKRYYPEPQFRRQYKLGSVNYWDAFDITLSDKRNRRKFVLTADARHKLMINSGSLVKLKKLSRHWNEVDERVIVVIHELEVTQTSAINVTEFMKLPWIPSGSGQEQESPLASGRTYYVDNWTFSIADNQNFGPVQHCRLADVDMSQVYSIKDIVIKSVSLFSKPILLVKVMRKGRLVQYISPYKEDKWPFQLPLFVADRSGWCSAVLWNRFGPLLHSRIREGTILMLQNFRLKKSVQTGLKSFFSPPQGSRIFNHELSLEHRNPESTVKLVDWETNDELEQLEFPALETCLVPHRHLMSVPDLQTLDVAGLVTFVGRVEREPRKTKMGHQEDSGGFFYRRWILLRDRSLDLPMVVLVYCGEQKDVFHNLKPGQFLLCRHMLTNQNLASLASSRQLRHIWLTTTAYSWLYTFDPENTEELPPPLSDHVQELCPPQPQVFQQSYAEGGFFSFPPLPHKLEDVESTREAILITPSNIWHDKFDRMTWQGCHQLAVHARLISAQYFTFTGDNVLVKNGNARNSHLTNNSKMPARRTESTKEVLPIPDSSTAANSNDEASENEQTEHLGLLPEDNISCLWPRMTSGALPETKGILFMRWQGLNETVLLNTHKPCALKESTTVSSFQDLIAGVHDSHLGPVQCDRFVLDEAEVRAVIESAQRCESEKFVLLVDVYTTDENTQLVVLKRAFQT